MPVPGSGREERWARRERHDRRVRIVRWTVAVVIVLGLVGWITAPTVRDWWVARSACDGALPDGALDDLREAAGDSDQDFGDYEESTHKSLGRFDCEVDNEKGERLLEVAAYTRSDDVAAQLTLDFDGSGGGRRATEALPANLPGFKMREDVGNVLLRECPDLGKDAAGKPRQLYVSVLAGHDVRSDRALRAGVAVANKAAEKLGCGADPLPVPGNGITVKSVPPARTAGTPCAAFADGPLQGKRWTVDMQVSTTGPVSTCSLRPSGKDEDGDPYEAVAAMHAWYGDWSKRLMYGDVSVSGGTSPRRKSGAWLTQGNAWASARCGGQTANYKVWSRGKGDADDADPERDGLDTTSRAQLGRVHPADLLAQLKQFTHDQNAKRSCKNVNLPATPEG